MKLLRKQLKVAKKTGSLKNPELSEELIEKFKGKTIQAPIEVIITCAIFLDACEILGVIEVLKHSIKLKIVEELKAKVEKDEITEKDIMLALMLDAMNKENTKQKNK